MNLTPKQAAFHKLLVALDGHCRDLGIRHSYHEIGRLYGVDKSRVCVLMKKLSEAGLVRLGRGARSWSIIETK